MELSREAIKKIRDIYYKEFGEQNSGLLDLLITDIMRIREYCRHCKTQPRD